MIHASASVSSDADIAADAEIGANAVIEGHVTIGPGTRVLPGAQLIGPLTIGARNVIGRCAVIGEFPQDLKFDPKTDSSVIIGDRNVIREHVTIHRGGKTGSSTRLGDDNFLMCGAHLGHDTVLGHRNVVANNVLFGGHVTVGNNNFFGGGSVFHQFTRVGDFCMTQGNSGFSKDLAPYCVGYSVNLLSGLNVIGLRRAGFSAEERAEIKDLFHLLLDGDLNFSQAITEAESRSWGQAARNFLTFAKAPSAKGVCRRSPVV